MSNLIAMWCLLLQENLLPTMLCAQTTTKWSVGNEDILAFFKPNISSVISLLVWLLTEQYKMNPNLMKFRDKLREKNKGKKNR